MSRLWETSPWPKNRYTLHSRDLGLGFRDYAPLKAKNESLSLNPSTVRPGRLGFITLRPVPTVMYPLFMYIIGILVPK